MEKKINFNPLIYSKNDNISKEYINIILNNITNIFLNACFDVLYDNGKLSKLFKPILNKNYKCKIEYLQASEKYTHTLRFEWGENDVIMIPLRDK